MKSLRMMTNIIDRIILTVCMLLMAAMTCLAGAQCFSRYVLSTGLVLSEEVCRYMFCWIVLLGSASCVKRRKHVAMTLLLVNVPPALRKAIILVVHLLSMLLFATMIRYGLQLVSVAMQQFSPALRLCMGYVYSVIPISGVLMILFTVENFLADLFVKADQVEIGGGEI